MDGRRPTPRLADDDDDADGDMEEHYGHVCDNKMVGYVLI